MDSVSGQTFMNYAYSWGAAVVILGTLFKLTHLPGANVMLFIGMGTEVFVFFISAFDRPFDKTQEGRNLATDTELAAALAAQEAQENGIGTTSGIVVPENIAAAATSGNAGKSPASQISGGTIIIGGDSRQSGSETYCRRNTQTVSLCHAGRFHDPFRTGRYLPDGV